VDVKINTDHSIALGEFDLNLTSTLFCAINKKSLKLSIMPELNIQALRLCKKSK